MTHLHKVYNVQCTLHAGNGVKAYNIWIIITKYFYHIFFISENDYEPRKMCNTWCNEKNSTTYIYFYGSQIEITNQIQSFSLFRLYCLFCSFYLLIFFQLASPWYNNGYRDKTSQIQLKCEQRRIVFGE